MKVVIPAKLESTRVRYKNWREFYQGKCLVDLTIEKLLLAGFLPGDIYVSCDCAEALRQLRGRYSVRGLERDPKLCDNSVSLTHWISEIIKEISYENEIAWAQVCDPLFDEYDLALNTWERRGKAYDSLCVVYKTKQYLLDPQHNPVGWQFGNYHKTSQTLSTMYTMPFTFSILTEESLAHCPYHIGAKPLWYETEKRGIDIDTEEDFELAQHVYQFSRRST